MISIYHILFLSFRKNIKGDKQKGKFLKRQILQGLKSQMRLKDRNGKEINNSKLINKLDLPPNGHLIKTLKSFNLDIIIISRTLVIIIIKTPRKLLRKDQIGIEI